jgi:hypothetical protein
VTLIFSDISCPHCPRGRHFKSTKALHAHIRVAHTGAKEQLDRFIPTAFSLTRTMIDQLDALGPNRSETMRMIVDAHFGGRQ